MTTDETRVMATVRRAISDAEHALQEPRDTTTALRHLAEIINIADALANIIAKEL